MLGYRIVVDGDYGAQTRSVVTNFQTRVGIVADGIAGAQTEAKPLSEQTGLDRREAPFAQPPAESAIAGEGVESSLNSDGNRPRPNLRPAGATVSLTGNCSRRLLGPASPTRCHDNLSADSTPADPNAVVTERRFP